MNTAKVLDTDQEFHYISTLPILIYSKDMTRTAFLFLLLFITSFLSSFAQDITLIEAFDETFDRPVGLEYSHEESPLIYLVQQNGIIKVLSTDEPGQSSSIWFNISSKILASGEKGLLGLAFHPNYPANETFYVNYNFVTPTDELMTRISRFYAPGGVADPQSEEILLSFDQPRSNHNGGQLAFGPDGYLYISLGDGGGSSSRLNSQDLTDFMGDILRIDVNTETGYAIPADNPFVNNPDAMDEIYSLGFRNPWRMSFDPETGDLWVADVGETNRESIYLAEKGKNYGWPIVEGTYCFESENCDTTNIEIPFYEYIYDQEDTGRSITGGYVYRGKDNPSLTGKYVYGDFMSGRIWALEIDHQTNTPIANTMLLETGMRIPTFGLDGSGEIYTLGWGSSAKIYRFTPELTLTTATLKSVDGSGALQLTWDVNRDSGIDSFEIYKGSSLNSLTLFTTVSGSLQDYIDSDPLNGSTFYKVRAIESGGNAGEMSDPVSYYKSRNTISESWQMMSLPYNTDGEALVNTVAYNFNGTYSNANVLESGKGYWVRSIVSGGSEFEVEGLGVQAATLQLNEGWNLVGGLTGELPNEFIVDDGGILNTVPMYGFNGVSYEETISLMPGQGYWLYAEQSGEITLDLNAYSATLPLNSVLDNSSEQAATNQKFDRFAFETANGNAEFFVSQNSLPESEKNRFLLPPVAPNAELDVRTDRGFKLAEGDRFEPEIFAKDYPLIIRFVSAGDKDLVFSNEIEKAYEVRVSYISDGSTETMVIKEGDSIKMDKPFSSLEFLRTEITDELVKETELMPSYPNPFNPTTNITYRISNQIDVSLIIFDATGRRIATLVDSEQDAGQYTLPFDASGLASGIYFVRFSAGDMLSTQKLTLIK